MIWAKKRFQVLQRDNFRCQYCGKNGKDVSLEVDHIIPKSKGWKDDFDNLITCCRECNIGKWDEIVWVDINIGKLKAAEHEDKMLKQFFDKRNDVWYGTIEKRNLSFISWFVRLYYGDYLKNYIDEKVEHTDFTMADFNDWNDKCEKILNEFDECWAFPEIDYIICNLEESDTDNLSEWTRETDDYNERLNWLISYQTASLWLSKPFNYKYSLATNKIDEWQNENQ